ncbi:MAG: AI-2E family transporter, partial [Myxococcota bacterium]
MDATSSGLDPNQRWLRYERYPFLLAKILTFGLVAFGLFRVLAAIQDVLTPVLVALFLAYLLDPAVDWFEARGHSRTTGIGLFLALGGGCVALFVVFLYPTVAHLIAQLTTAVPKLIDLVQHRGLPWVDDELLPWIGGYGVPVPTHLEELFGGIGDSARTQLPGLFQRATTAAADLWTRTGAIVASLLNVVLVPVLTFYFLRDFDAMRFATVEYLPAHNRGWLLDRIAKMDEVVGAWFRGQVEVALILAGLYAVGLAATFGLSGIGATSGIAIGLLAGLLNIVPYFGFAIGFVLSVLLAVLDWSGWGPLIGVGLTFAVVQGLEGYVVTPKIVGEMVGLSPVVVIVALLLGGSLLGLLGVLLALPLAG